MVAALAMMLETTGASVEVVMFFGVSEKYERRVGYEQRGKAVELYTTVKLPDSPVDVLSLAYALAHPSSMRRFCFAVLETMDKDIRKALCIPGLYGFPCEASHQGDLYIPAAVASDAQWQDPASARKWVIDAIRDQGVELNKA